MKKIILVASIAVLAACSQAEQAADTDAVEETADAAEVAAADGGPAYGTFKVTLADGSVLTDEVHEDGTFTATLPDGTTESGTWVQKPGEYCTTSSEEGASERCHKEWIDESGAWVSTDPEGNIATVERVVEEAAAE